MTMLYQIIKIPFHLCVAFLFITISIWHFYQGIEVVLEDYIHETNLRNSTLKTLKILCWFLTLIITLAFIFVSVLNLGVTNEFI